MASFKRFYRLAPAYYFVTFSIYFIFKFIGDGPLFPSGVERFITKNCDAHWWANLLFINNIIPLNITGESDGIE